jgi:hypothetical protein
MTNEEYIQAFRQWGIDRKIIGNGRYRTQYLKLLSEVGELADSLAKGVSPIDDIGDCIVVLVMIDGIAGIEGMDGFQSVSWDIPHPHSAYVEFRRFISAVSGSTESLPSVHNLATYLSRIAYACGLTTNECLAHAWNEIKDRKGYLNENGVFIKEDATSVQA